MGSLPQSLTSLIQDPLKFFPPIDTRIFHVTSFLQVFKSIFYINFSFLSLRGACHSNLTFFLSNLCYHIWREIWSYGSACYEISLDPSPNIPLNIFFWHSQCMSWWEKTSFTLTKKPQICTFLYFNVKTLLRHMNWKYSELVCNTNSENLDRF